MKKAVGIDKSVAAGSLSFFVGRCCVRLINNSRLRHIDPVSIDCDTSL
jgi:hypothetical protein